MKHIVFFFSFFLLTTFAQSCSNRSKQAFEAEKTITISYNPDISTPLDSLVSKITVVPLETNDNCLIGQYLVWVKQHKGLIYINNLFKQLLVFDMNGKFIREIGRLGQGPGEFSDLRDFIFTNEDTIEILDFLKIESYTLDGKHIGTKRFNLMGAESKCNPLVFCRSFSSGYFLWGGVDRDERLREKGSLMYRVNSDMQIENGYFSQKYGDGGATRHFSYYKDKTLVIPSSFDYSVYQIDPDDSVRIRYSFDFVKYGFDSSKEVDRRYISYEDYIYNIRDFHETDRFLYFHFSYQRYLRNVLYLKTTGRTYIQSLIQSVNRKEFGLYSIVATYNDQLIAMEDISKIKDHLKRMSPEEIQKWKFDDLHKLDDEANPVLIFYTLKIF